MRRFGAACSLAALLAVSGCGSEAEPQTAVEPSTPVTTSTSETLPTPAEPSAAETVATDTQCGIMFLESTAFLLGRGWNLVTASRGARDHGERVKNFEEQVDDLFDNAKDEPTKEARAACGYVELAELNYEVAVLNASVVISDEGEPDQYRSVADSANKWLEKVGVTDKVEPFTPTYAG